MKVKKKIFITGASSELITKLIALIDKDEYEIYSLSRNIKNKDKNKINWVEGDILEINKIKKYLKLCHILIHAAAVTHAYDKQKYFTVNFEATKKLVDEAVKYHVDKIVFISSRTAGLKSGAYGESKILAEQYIKENFDSWIIFRPAEIFGGSKDEGIQKLINDINTKRYIFYPNNVKSKLYPIFIDDCAKIIHDFTFNKKVVNKTVTVNGVIGFSYIDFVKVVSTVFRKKNKFIPIPKFLMLFIKIIIEIFHVKIGIVPDQIPRLYSLKENSNLKYKLLGIEEYLENYK